MNRSKMNILSSLLIALLATMVFKTGTARATSSFNCGAWRIVPSSNPGTSSNMLNGVTATSANNVWAVGTYSSNEGSGQTLTEHWDGFSWSVVSSPNPGSGSNSLNGIAAVSTSDIWAVGMAGDTNSGISQTLIEQWNGSSWSVVSSPSPGSGGSYLSALAAISANDIWAVGYLYSNNPVIQTLIEHWDGTSWSVVSSPNPGQDNVIYGVAAISTTNAWAVGDYYNPNSSSFQTLTEHWDGSSWSVVSSPNPGPGINSLNGVAPVPGTSGRFWAVGMYLNAISSTFQTLLEKWNGKRWKVISSPNVGQSDNSLFGVTVVSATNVWAVGNYANASNTLIEHWDGSSWSVVSSPSPGSLVAVAHVPGTHGHVWAVGTDSTQTLTEFYC